MTLPHPTAHARLAAYELAGGRYRVAFRARRLASLALALAAPWLAGMVAAGAALAALAACSPPSTPTSRRPAVPLA